MKCLTSMTLAAAVLLCGCASTNNPSGKVAAEEAYIPLGTLIARKNPSRADNTTTVDRQSLENDRMMGGSSPTNGR
ncbi:MAG: hypothetical protein M3R60_02515 [Pseudomonadota bacterium]|nr:hypothetical protein [Pseudomonadota bacterium]